MQCFGEPFDYILIFISVAKYCFWCHCFCWLCCKRLTSALKYFLLYVITTRANICVGSHRDTILLYDYTKIIDNWPLGYSTTQGLIRSQEGPGGNSIYLAVHFPCSHWPVNAETMSGDVSDMCEVMTGQTAYIRQKVGYPWFTLYLTV